MGQAHTPGAIDKKIAKRLLLLGIQEWGQAKSERDEAVTNYCERAGKARSDFQTMIWFKTLIAKMPRGKFESEVEYLVAALSAARATGGTE